MVPLIEIVTSMARGAPAADARLWKSRESTEILSLVSGTAGPALRVRYTLPLFMLIEIVVNMAVNYCLPCKSTSGAG